MKKIVFFIVCCLFVLSAAAQKRRNVDNLPTFDDPKIHYGFYLGLNKNDFKVNYRQTKKKKEDYFFHII